MTSIINADDGSISGRPGLRTISGTSANLQIQVNGTTVMNVSSNHSVTFNSTVHMPSIVSPTLETMSSSSGSAFAQANLAYTAANTAVTTGQANVGAGLITTTAAYQANVGAGLITTTAAYQANVGAARIEILGRADSAFGQANLAYTAANTAVTTGQANVGAGLITTTAAYQANVGAARIVVLGRADSAFGQANLAYSAANTKLASAGGTITGNLQIDGNLTISGTTTTVSANNLVVKDNMFYLNDEDFSSNVDLGFAGNYNDGTYRHTGLFRDASDGIWKFYDNYLPEPDAAVNIDTSNTSFRIATVFANVKTDVISVRGMDPLGVANSAFGQANLAYTAANTAVTTGQANVGAGLITTTAAYQANVGAARIVVLGRADSAFGQANLAYTAANTAVTSGQANVGAGLITTTAAYQANTGAGLLTRLPLAGGTMTGAITFAAGQTWPTFNQNTTGSAGSVAWSGITSKPTTVSGFGITNALVRGGAIGNIDYNVQRTLASGIYSVDNAPTNGPAASAYSNFIQMYERGDTAAQLVIDYGTGRLYTRGIQTATPTYSAWRTQLDDGNYSSYALPLAGGTMTGAITFAAGQTWPTFNQSTTGNAATATALQTARTIGGVSFNGTANINLPGVNTAGNQNTTGSAATATTATNQSGGTVSATTGAFSGAVTFAGGSGVGATGDIVARRSSGATGVYYFVTNGGSVYLYYDGGSFNFSGATGLNVAGFVAASGTVAGTNITSGGNTTGTAAGNLALAGGTMTGQLTTRVTSGATPIVSGGGSDSLQVMGNASNGAWVSFHRAGAYAVNLGLDTSNVVSLGGWSDGATSRWTSDTSGNFVARGNVTAYSDERLKKDWKPVAEDFVERLAKVKHGTFTRTDSNERQAGVSAQEWQKLLPETVLTSADGFLSVAYGNAALVAAVKLAERVVALEARLAALEAKGTQA